MAYTKQTWNTGDTITSAKLNHMEDGIASGGAFIINVIDDGAIWTLDKTWQQIYEAFYSGSGCVVKIEQENNQSLYNVNSIRNYYGDYIVGFSDNLLHADSPDGYPSVSFE